MATTPRPLLMRPVEYVYMGDAFSVDGGSSYNDFPTGTYANPIELLHSVCTHLYNDSVGTIWWSINDDFKFQLTGSGVGITLVWDDTTLRDILGFTGASTVIPNGSAVTATYTPQYTWIPSYQRSDQDSWSTDLSECAVGTESEDGTWSGIPRGASAVYRQTIHFPQELETNLVVSADGSDAYQAERCLETFLKGSMQAMPTSAGSVSPKGFWFFPDINDALMTPTLPSDAPFSETTTNQGVRYNYTDNADTRTFCMTSPRECGTALRSSPTFAASRIRYAFSFGFHTAPVPSEGWTYVDKS